MMFNHAVLFLLLMNVARAHTGVAPLRLDPELSRRAEVRAEYLCAMNQWSHDGWEVSFAGLDWKEAGENLAEGYTGVYSKEMALEASPEHEANILGRQFGRAGVGEHCGITVQLFED